MIVLIRGKVARGISQLSDLWSSPRFGKQAAHVTSPRDKKRQKHEGTKRQRETVDPVLRKAFPHGVHAFVTFVTFGAWLPVWIQKKRDAEKAPSKTKNCARA